MVNDSTPHNFATTDGGVHKEVQKTPPGFLAEFIQSADKANASLIHPSEPLAVVAANKEVAKAGTGSLEMPPPYDEANKSAAAFTSANARIMNGSWGDSLPGGDSLTTAQKEQVDKNAFGKVLQYA